MGIRLVFIWSCQRGETLHKQTTGSNTSYISNLLGNKEKCELAEGQDSDIHEYIDIIGRGISHISFNSKLTCNNIKARW